MVNIPESFLTIYMDDYVIMVLRGRMAELMEKTETSIHQKFVTIENIKTVLYVKFQKALYGSLRSALLFYENLVSDLNSRGFIINPYNT